MVSEAKIKKAGCVLLSSDYKSVGLVYREKLKDYTFPKGHLEEDETLFECALRETREEVQRECEMLQDNELGVIRYCNYEGDVEVYMFLAVDIGYARDKIEDELKEKLVWTNLEDVYDKLSYDNLKEFWLSIYDKIKEIIKK